MMDMGLPSAGNKYLVDHAVRDLIVFDMLDVTGPGQYRLTGWAYAAMRGQFERAESRSALVQPTGEIMVPPATPLQERWLIDGLATRVKSDRVSTYRIDRASVRRGINQSLTATRHAEALEALTRNPLPDNVRVNLEDWYRLYQRHQIIEATFIHSLSAQDSRSIETILGSDAVERLTETDIAIPQSRIKNVVKKLDKAGSPILPEIKRPSQDATVTAQPDYPDANQLWPLHLFDEASPPDQSVTEIRQLMAAAMRNGQALSLIFHMPGESRTHMATVVPVSLQDKWIQVYLIEDRRYLMVDWGQILSAEMLPSPV